MSEMLWKTVGLTDVNAVEKWMEQLPEKAWHFGLKVFFALVVFIVGIWLIKMVRKIIHKAFLKANADKGVAQFTESFVRIALYVVLLLTIASAFGMDATGVVAILGSAGVAIGLALQGSLSNFAGGILILLIKPFVIGDYIVACGEEGKVTSIDMCYTKLTTSDDRIVVLPNGTLANATIENNTATPQRRAEVFVSVSYDANLELAKEMIWEAVRTEDFVLKEKEIVVYVSELGAHSVDIGIRYYTKNEDYFISKGIVLEKIKKVLDEHRIEIPYQQLDVHMK